MYNIKIPPKDWYVLSDTIEILHKYFIHNEKSNYSHCENIADFFGVNAHNSLDTLQECVQIIDGYYVIPDW